LFAGDWFKPYHHEVPKILERGISVFIYAGDADFICKYANITSSLTDLVGWGTKHGQKRWNGLEPKNSALQQPRISR
jgi:carboxypeptidase C (cathepsin A)